VLAATRSIKNILVCLYGTTGSFWNRYSNVLALEEINKISRKVLIKTKDIVQELGFELVYADTTVWATDLDSYIVNLDETIGDILVNPNGMED
jgi:DNA polymerase elongation subunit (family B)